MTQPVLDVRHLCIQFPSSTTTAIAVDEISFTLPRGQTLGIVGESGSGKSVTALAILGLIPEPGKISQGEIWFCESEGQPVDLVRLPEEQRRLYRGKAVAMIFQDPMSSLNPVFTIGFQLTEAIRLHQQVGKGEARRRAIAALQEVRLLPNDDAIQAQATEMATTAREQQQWVNQQKRGILERYPHELSGGQQQRVMIAMAIACNPTLLIADEPTTALDVTVQASILKLLADLCRSRQMSLVFITHDLGVIAEVADQVAVMYRGKIVECDRVHTLFQSPQHPYTQGLLACRPRLDIQQSYLPTVADYLAGKVDRSSDPLVEPVEPVKSNARTPLLRVENLTVGFPIKGVLGWERRYFMAVNDLSFEVYAGETLGLVGESGCGKSTLALTLLRLTRELAGQIYFDGQNITHAQGATLKALRRQMQIVFQNPYNSLNPRMAVGKAIMEPLQIHGQGKTKADDRNRAAYLLERVGLDPGMMNRFPHEFSGGQRQRICIARALALNPRFIICDESVSALDVSVQAQVLNLLKELQREFGLTYIFISHDLSVVKFMSDRIMVMNKGKIEEIDRADQIYTNPQTDYTKQLIAAIPAGL